MTLKISIEGPTDAGLGKGYISDVRLFSDDGKIHQRSFFTPHHDDMLGNPIHILIDELASSFKLMYDTYLVK